MRIAYVKAKNDLTQILRHFCLPNMHSKVPINIVYAEVNVVPKKRKIADAGPPSPVIKLRYLLGHIYIFRKNIGTVMHPENWSL